MEVHAGHGLTYQTAKMIKKIKNILMSMGIKKIEEALIDLNGKIISGERKIHSLSQLKKNRNVSSWILMFKLWTWTFVIIIPDE